MMQYQINMLFERCIPNFLYNHNANFEIVVTKVEAPKAFGAK